MDFFLSSDSRAFVTQPLFTRLSNRVKDRRATQFRFLYARSTSDLYIRQFRSNPRDRDTQKL